MRTPSILVVAHEQDCARARELTKGLCSAGMNVWLDLTSAEGHGVEADRIEHLFALVDLTVFGLSNAAPTSPRMPNLLARTRRHGRAASRFIAFRVGYESTPPVKPAAKARERVRFRTRVDATLERIFRHSGLLGTGWPCKPGIEAVSSQTGVSVVERDAALDHDQLGKLLEAWSACVPVFVEQERHVRPASEVLDAAQVLAALRAFEEVFGAVPTVRDLREATPQARHLDLFYRFLAAFHGAPERELARCPADEALPGLLAYDMRCL